MVDVASSVGVLVGFVRKLLVTGGIRIRGYAEQVGWKKIPDLVIREARETGMWSTTALNEKFAITGIGYWLFGTRKEWLGRVVVGGIRVVATWTHL